MPRITYYTPAERDCFISLNKEHTYRKRYDVELIDDMVALPQECLDIMLARCPTDFYDSLNRRPLQKPDEFLVEPTSGDVPSLRFFDFTAAAVHEKNVDESTIGILTPDPCGRITLPISYIVKASLREAKPKRKLVLGPFENYDTFGIWIPQFYEKALKKKKD